MNKYRDLNIEKNYQNNSAETNAKRRINDFIWEVPEKLFLINKKYFSNNKCVVDMGCGTSLTIKHSLDKSTISKIRYIGVDISRKILKFAQKNIPSGKFIEGDFSNVSLKPNSVDIILSFGVLHHSINQLETLNHWYTLLKPNGLILLREPTYESLKKGQGESPIEEGIKLERLKHFIIDKHLTIISFHSFYNQCFHFFNRTLIKIGLKKWQNFEIFWYPIVIIDTFFSSLFGFKIPFFKGDSFTMIIKKT